MDISQDIAATNHLAVEQGTLDLNNLEQLRRHLWQQMILKPSIPTNQFWSVQGSALGYGRVISEQEQNFARKVTGRTLPIGTLYFIKYIPNQRQFYLIDSQGKPEQLIYTFNNDFRKLTWYRQAKAVG